jgi:hypothetical protein
MNLSITALSNQNTGKSSDLLQRKKYTNNNNNNNSSNETESNLLSSTNFDISQWLSAWKTWLDIGNQIPGSNFDWVLFSKNIDSISLNVFFYFNYKNFFRVTNQKTITKIVAVLKARSHQVKLI